MLAWFYELHTYGTHITIRTVVRCDRPESVVRLRHDVAYKPDAATGILAGPFSWKGPGWNFVGSKPTSFWHSANSIWKKSTVPYPPSAYTYTHRLAAVFRYPERPNTRHYTREYFAEDDSGRIFVRPQSSQLEKCEFRMKSRVRFEIETPNADPGGSSTEHGFERTKTFSRNFHRCLRQKIVENAPIMWL